MSTKNRAKSRSRDPQYEREKSRYEDPIASREYILEVLTVAGVPLTEDELAQRLKIHKRQREALARRLAAMERTGQILRNRKGAVLVAEKIDVVAGRIEGHPDGYGFLAPDAGGEDMYLGHREMRKAMHGDRVLARAIGLDRRGRREGAIVEVVERAHASLVGRFHREREFLIVTPADRRISHEVLVAHKDSKDAEPGQVVVVELISQPTVDAEGRESYTPPIGRITEVLGHATDPGMEIEIALRKHDLPFEFSAKAKQQAARLPSEVKEPDIGGTNGGGRKDVRDLPLVTIDGETAKDFDDAVFCEPKGKGWRLVVAIADVSHYVRDGEPLDADARERGTSVYFPRRVIPMLPEKLSNGLCSLNADVDRLCMVCDMAITATGAVRRFEFYASVMRSRARLTYTRVAAALGDPKGADAKALGELLVPVQHLYDLYKVLAQARSKRGAIDFETVETKFVFDKQGRLASIEPTQRNDAHRVIEECMLAANVCASAFLQENEQPALYRIHEGPTPEKLENLRNFLKSFGLQLGGGDKPGAKDYAKLLESVKHRPDLQLLQMVMLRSLRQAVYSPDNVGHFGLAYEAYTHFTSPIRRYPDLLVHRAIKAVLEGRRYKPEASSWSELGVHCSGTERRADEASREVESWLKAYYMKDRVGEEFDGVITAVTAFGIFVALDGLFVEGLVHVSELGSDYYHYDPTRHELLGERTKKRFRLSDRVRIKVVRVDLDSARMDFVLA